MGVPSSSLPISSMTMAWVEMRWPSTSASRSVVVSVSRTLDCRTQCHSVPRTFPPSAERIGRRVFAVVSSAATGGTT